MPRKAFYWSAWKRSYYKNKFISTKFQYLWSDSFKNLICLKSVESGHLYTKTVINLGQIDICSANGTSIRLSAVWKISEWINPIINYILALEIMNHVKWLLSCHDVRLEKPDKLFTHISNKLKFFTCVIHGALTRADARV